MLQRKINCSYEPATIKIHVKGSETPFTEISLVAIDESSGRIRFIGREAKDSHAALLNYIENENREKHADSLNYVKKKKTPISHYGNVLTFSPLRRGIIADFDYASQMFHIFLLTACLKRNFFFKILHCNLNFN